MLLDVLSARLFRTLSRLRRARVFHPRGAAYEAVWQPAVDSRDQGSDGELRAVVRMSRGVGLPPPSPDVLGVAIKVIDAHGPGHDQDLLLVSAGPGRWGSCVLRPAWSFSGTTFSSLLPYEVSDTRTAVIAVVHGEPTTSIDDADARPDVRVAVSLARTGTPLATVVLTRPLSAAVARDLRFDPWNTGGSMQPAGLLNRVRRPVYAASQDGRSAPPGGARRREGRSTT